MTATTPTRQAKRKLSARPRTTDYFTPLIAGLLVLLALAVVVLSPFAVDFLDDGGRWTRRSEIGQTYGAAAALLSVFALAAISISLILQAREIKLAREQASRSTHTELMTMAMEDPIYRECWGMFSSEQDETALRQQLYTNLIMSYWQTRFELGTFSEAHLRHGASMVFSGRPGRAFWENARDARMKVSQTRRARRFHAIIDDEYQKSLAATPILDQSIKRSTSRMAPLLRRIADRLDRPGR